MRKNLNVNLKNNTMNLHTTSRLCAFVWLFLLILPLSSCTRRWNVNQSSEVVNEIIEEIVVAAPDPLQIQAAEIVSSLDDRLLAAQVFICGIDGRGTLPPHIIALLGEYPPGGVMFFRVNLNTPNDEIRNLLDETVSLVREESGIAPFIAVDHEGGTVNRFQRGVATLPAASVYWELALAEGKQAALEKIEEDSLRAGSEIFDLGFNLNFAPVAEHLNDDNREFLASRSYGPDPVFTAQAAAAFIRGMEQAGVLCVVKHFPGSAGPDPHYSLSVIKGDRAAIDELAYPFAALVGDGIRAVMAAHTAVPAIDNVIASLSAAVMEDWLRGELGFAGIIISDDFRMAAAGGQNPEELAVTSIAAGSDIVLVWPQDLRRTHREILSALEDGRLSRERLREAVQRIIYEKLRMGIESKSLTVLNQP